MKYLIEGDMDFQTTKHISNRKTFFFLFNVKEDICIVSNNIHIINSTLDLLYPLYKVAFLNKQVNGQINNITYI